MQFQKAQRRKAKLRLGVAGPSGSGKTMSALLIAKGIGGRIAVIDTERDSASLYAEPIKLPDGTMFQPPEFDALCLEPPYAPERFIEAIKAAETAGYDICIIDSTTAEWSGLGGCLELVDHVSKASFGGNSYMAWSAITPRHRAFLDAMLRSSMHIIATMRSKTETAQVDDGRKKKVIKLGMKAEQRDGIEYEFTTVLDLIHDGHFAVASKDRTGLFAGDPERITEETGRRVMAWLENGEEPAPTALEVCCQAMRACISADDFKATWAINKDAWKALLSDRDYAALVAVMQDQAKRWAPKPEATAPFTPQHEEEAA
jgi:hypothetical protein